MHTRLKLYLEKFVQPNQDLKEVLPKVFKPTNEKTYIKLWYN